MRRICFVLQVNPDRIEGYKSRHRAVWPEMLAALRETGWNNYSLFLRPDGLLVGYLETEDFERARAGMATREVNERWQREMSGFFLQPRRALAGSRHGSARRSLPPVTIPFLRRRMLANPALGVFFHWLGGLASGSFYVPYRGVRRWSWETYWLVGGVFSWIIAPWFLGWLMTRDLLAVLSETPSRTLFWAFFFGLLWGVGGLTFGLTMRFLGLSLGMAVVLGLCAALGTLMPPIFRGVFVSQVLGTTSSRCQGLAPDPAQPFPSFCTMLSTTMLPVDSTLGTSASSDPGAPLYWMRTAAKERAVGNWLMAAASEMSCVVYAGMVVVVTK